MNNASPANEYCYTCEPPSANETLNYFGMFPEPNYSPSWTAAVAYVTAGAKGDHSPVWDLTLTPGLNWTDPATGITSLLPGSPLPRQMNRDP